MLRVIGCNSKKGMLHLNQWRGVICMLDQFFSNFEGFILPIILIITGRVLWKHPSIDIEIRIGRKSTLCIEDEEKKEQIREYCGKLGIVLLVFSAFIHILYLLSSKEIIGILVMILPTVQVLCVCIDFILMGRFWKKNFPKDG